MILRTPRFIEPIFYVGFDSNARRGDELLAVSVGRLYAGFYPTEQGVEICCGILNAQGAL